MNNISSVKYSIIFLRYLLESRKGRFCLIFGVISGDTDSTENIHHTRKFGAVTSIPKSALKVEFF